MKSEEIVRLLKDRDDFISGAEMANILKITRAAIWKRITLLRKKGYTIQASPARGYRLIKSPELSMEEIKISLPASLRKIGSQLRIFDSVVSTNKVAAEFAAKDYPDGTVIISDTQTGGKGRLGRLWLSPPEKNVYMSIIMRPDILPKDATILTIMSSVACASAIRNLTSIPVTIKWPNDMLVSNKKLGGILTEIKSDMDRIHYAVVGIGININMDISDMPDELKTISTSIKNETGEAWARSQVAVSIIKELDKWYDILSKMGKKPIIDEWLQLSATIGQKVKITIGDTILTGIAEGIDEEGMLILKLPDNSFKKISAGDLTHVRAAEQ